MDDDETRLPWGASGLNQQPPGHPPVRGEPLPVSRTWGPPRSGSRPRGSGRPYLLVFLLAVLVVIVVLVATIVVVIVSLT